MPDSSSGSPRGTRHRRGISRRARGRRGEELAAEFLVRRGFRIVSRNVHARIGEIDLVALHGRTLCFVEVRLRSSLDYGSAAASVTPTKQLRLVRAARRILATTALPSHDHVRFDVVTLDASTDPPQIELIEDAFGA